MTNEDFETNPRGTMERLEKYTRALEEISGFSGLTLLGCSGTDCDAYPSCFHDDPNGEKAHTKGANRAFEQAAAVAKEALDD